MGSNKRLSRNSARRSQKKQTTRKAYGSQHKNRGSRYFDILEQFYAAEGASSQGFYYALRQLRGQEPEADWVVVNNIFEAVTYGHKPAAIDTTALDELRKRFRSSHEEYLAYLSVQKYAGEIDWNDPQNQLCQTYKKSLKNQFNFIDLPALAHFYKAEYLDEKSPAVEYLWEKIDLFVSELTFYEVSDISKTVHRSVKPPTKPKLVKLNWALSTLGSEAQNHPLFQGFLEPFFKGVVQRFYKSAPLSSRAHPTLYRYFHAALPLKGPEASGVAPLGEPLGQVYLRLTFRDLVPTLVSDEVLMADGVSDFVGFIKKLLVKWRFWIEAHTTVQAAPMILEEEKSFKALWTALSHGVPQSHRDFAGKTKEICAEFFRKQAAKGPSYRPKVSIVQEIYRFDQDDSGTRWLYFSLGGCADRTLASKPTQTPRLMPFNLFYTLYVDHKLSGRAEFINNYLLLLPRESQRELLAQWFRRVQSELNDHQGLRRVTELTFDKLLARGRFPVAELETMPEIDPAMLAWSLAYLKFKKQGCPKIGYQKALAFISYLLTSPVHAFFETYGVNVVVDLLPQLAQEEAIKLGALEKLLKVAEIYQNPQLEIALETALDGDLFQMAPVGEKIKLKAYLGRHGKSVPKPSPKTSPKPKRSRRDESSIPF